MVSKNNLKWKQQRDAQRVPHYGLRKLSVGVASVLLSTTLYMGATASADTVSEPSGEPTVTQPTSAATGSSTGSATANAQLKSTTDQPANVVTGASTDNTTADTKPAQTANAVTSQPTADQPAGSVTSGVQPAANSVAPKNDVSAQSAPASASAALPKQPANVADSTQPFMNLAVTSDNNDVAKPTRETVGSQWRIHYIDSTNREHELKDPTVINMQYVRTNTPQSDGMIQHGDWSYVPGSFKLTGTPITVNDSDNPVKEDNVTNNGKNEDVFTITVWHPAITGYTMHDNVTHTRLQDHLLNYAASGEFQAPTMGQDFDVEYDPIDKRSVAVKFIDDQHVGQQVGQAITLTGHDGDTVNLKLTVPDKYELADGQQLPTSYTFAKGSGDLKIHLVHKVVQREATINVQLLLTTAVHRRDNDYAAGTVTQARWKQLEEQFGDEIKYAPGGPDVAFEALPSVKAGTLTGHVDYDLVDERVTSLGDDWTTLNLGGKTYQLPNGDDVVNGIMIDGDATWGKSFKEENLKSAQIVHVDVDPDYATRAWHGYLSVNATNNDNNGLIDEVHSLGLQAGLVGDEPNALAKTIGDRAATAVEMSNKPIDLNLLRSYDFDFSEQNGQLRAKVGLPLAGVYVPYVEKTATRTINVTTPDGETKTVKQTATLAKQVDFGKHAHPDWTTGEWAAYNVPTIPGYTASQTSVAATPVDGNTKDQTVNITYTANNQTIHVKYVDTDRGDKLVQSTAVTGKTGETVSLNLTVPDKYQLADGQQLPTTYTFAAYNGDVTIHLTHKVVQREATADAQLGLVTLVDFGDEIDLSFAVTQNHWKQLDDDIKDSKNPNSDKVFPSTKVGTLTGHVNYDLVDNKVVSFANDWTNLSLGSRIYHMPDGTEVVNGVSTGSVDSWGKSLKEQFLKYYPDADPDYVNRPWHGYLSANATNKLVASDFLSDYLQTGLAGNESNTLAKAIGDQAVTAVKTAANKTIDSNWLNRSDYHTFEFSERDGQLRNDVFVPVVGVYIPYVEKTVTRTINVTTPDGKTTTVKQTATLAKQVDFSEGAHPAWTTGEWTNYDVPVIPGYTASQSQVAKETVTGETKDQIVNITYTANDQSTHVNYVDAQGKTIHTTTVNGKTGQTVKVSSEVPAGWKLVDGQTVPSEITFGPDGHADTSVKIEHRHVTVTPDAPKTTADHLPDNPGKTYPAGVGHNDLNKTVTGTINVTMPDGQVKTVVKTAKLTRTADVDEVTGDVKYSDWTTGYWSDYTAPVVPGYTANYPYIAGQSVTGSMEDQTLEITYTANDQATHVNYVDAQGKTIHATAVNGKTGQTVKVSSEIPDGWKLVDGQSVPSEITFGPDGHTDVSVKIEHRQVTVTPDHPQTNGTKLPDNPAKTFNGVEANDLNKTITRTIKVTQPDGTVTNKVQTVKLTRTATVDEVTGEVTYGKWTTGAWDAYTIPSVKGYTASQASVAATPVDENTKDQTVEVSYTANKQSTTIKYADDKGQVVHTTTVNGVTGQTVKVPSEVPTGWMITKGQVPNEIAFGADGHEPIEVTVAHRHVTVDPDHPQINGTKLPDNPAQSFHGVEASDLNKTATRTIKVTTPDGKTTTTKQTVKLTRTATVDEVTGDVSYGKWTTGQWAKYDVPTVSGYTATQTEVAAVSVNEHTTDQTVNITYTANPQTTTVKYVDDKGEVIHTTTVDGVTNQTVTVPSAVPVGWTITKGQVPSEITFGANGHEPIEVTVAHHHVTVTPDHPQTNGTKLPDNPAKTFNGVEANDLNKTITRTIKVTTPDGQTKTVAQTAKLTRNADVDEVTGEVTYGNWATGQWDAYEVPTVPGYTASQTSVAVTPVDGNTKDQTIDISYTANSQTTHINYVDESGKTVHTTTVTGKTGETVKVPNEVPAGWMITKGQVPSEISFGPNGHTGETITIGHRHVTVDPDHPQTNGTKLPDNPAKTFNGVEENDLNKTITRTIKVTTPDGQTKTVTQTAKLTRTADVDEVTGEVAYGDWTTGEWAAYNTPSVAGYTPSQAKVDKETVTAASKDTTTVITYTPNQHQINVEYVDDDAHGKIVKTDQVPGKTDQTITVTPSAPVNYDLVDNGNRTYTVTSGDGQRVQIHVTHQQVTTSESKTVARTINVHTPHDGVKTVKQTVELNRDVTTDQVTGEKTYGDWTTGQWKAYTPEAISGYTPSTNEVPTANVDGSSTDQTVDVTYTANAQHVDIVYVDDTKDGAAVKTDQVVGKTDETVKVTPNVPTGYKVVGEVPGSYTMTADGHQTITVHLVHQTKTVSESKAVTRTINVNTPHDGTTVFKQTVDLSRDVTTDQVTGDKTYGDWSTTEWTHYDVPVIAGYTPSIKQVAQQVVDGTTKDQTVNVTYTANTQTTHVNYVDGDGNVVHTTTITGKTDQTVKVPNETPAGWKVVGESVPTEITFGPDGHTDVAVTVDHQHATVTPDDPKTPADKLPNNPGKTYPDGVGHDDLNRTVTRTIKVVTPDGQTKTVTQKVQLTRTADIDEVTGKVTYGDWTTGEWSRYEVPSVPGYTPSQSEVPAVNVTDTTKDQMLTLTYTANDQTTHVNYVDGNDKTVHMTTITGKTDQTVKVPNEVPTGWTITKGQVPAEITFGPDGHTDVMVTVGHQHVTVTPDQPKTPSDKLPNNPGKTYPSGVGHDDLNKTVTRTIKVTTPDGKTQTTAQKVQLTRNADVDEVTGEVTYGKWTTGEWTSYNVPTVPGYTASQREVPATKVTSDTKNQTVTVTYTANTQTTTISYVDQNGKTVHTTVVNGHTDQTVKVPNETPAGWTITKGQVPTEITFGPNGHDHVTVTVDHKHVAVTPDKPQTDGTKLPGNPSKTFHGVGHNDLNKTIVRTIEVTAPTGKTDTVKQTVKLTRSADVDEVTGEVTYSKWTTGAWSSYNAPAVPGYTPSQAVVAEAAVNADTTNQTVKINYTANAQTTHINYVDENGEVVHTTTIKGYTDQTVKVPNETPAGWTITKGQVPSEVTFGTDGYTDVKITVDHKTVTVAPDDPKTDGTKLPDNPALTFHGVEHDDLNKTVTRTIKVTTPDGKTQTVAQKVQLTRSADVDEATGEVTYGDWSTGAWEAYQAPTVPGYTASQSTVPATTVTAETEDQTVTITYMANEQTTHINYVDENGNVVHTTTVTGHTDQTVKVPNEVPTGWTITTGEVPSEVTFGADGHDNVTVTVDHKTVTVAPDHPQTDGTKLPDNPALTFHGVGENDLNRTVTRTFTLNVPGRDPQVVTQTAKLTRTATVDEVTGDVTYGDWTTGHWDAYEVPTVDGYTTDQKMIPAVDVTDTTTSQEIAIDYTAVPAKPETPAKPAVPSKHQTNATQAPAAKAKAPVQTPAVKAKANAQAQQAPQAQTLPQTGEKQNTLAPVGAALLGLLGGFGLFGKKRKKDEGDEL